MGRPEAFADQRVEGSSAGHNSGSCATVVYKLMVSPQEGNGYENMIGHTTRLKQTVSSLFFRFYPPPYGVGKILKMVPRSFFQGTAKGVVTNIGK